jgi:hypothetical protein
MTSGLRRGRVLAQQQEEEEEVAMRRPWLVCVGGPAAACHVQVPSRMDGSRQGSVGKRRRDSKKVVVVEPCALATAMKTDVACAYDMMCFNRPCKRARRGAAWIPRSPLLDSSLLLAVEKHHRSAQGARLVDVRVGNLACLLRNPKSTLPHPPTRGGGGPKLAGCNAADMNDCSHCDQRSIIIHYRERG